MRIQGLLRKTTRGTHWRADKGWPIQQWSVRSALLLACVVSVVSAQAGTIIGGSNLLDDAGLGLLEGWLGEGELDVTNIFTKETGDTSEDFHAAVDGEGRTFTLVEVLDGNGDLHLIGGYNPQSWNSLGTYNLTPNDSDRTAFLFSLTNEVVHRQRLSDWPGTVIVGDIGLYQTYNASNIGPTFGGGWDFYVDNFLMSGQVNAASYGDSDYDYGPFASVLGVASSPYSLQIGQIEVFTIASAFPAVVPIPAPAALGMLGMGLVAAVRRRKKSAQV